MGPTKGLNGFSTFFKPDSWDLNLPISGVNSLSWIKRAQGDFEPCCYVRGM